MGQLGVSEGRNKFYVQEESQKILVGSLIVVKIPQIVLYFSLQEKGLHFLAVKHGIDIVIRLWQKLSYAMSRIRLDHRKIAASSWSALPHFQIREKPEPYHKFTQAAYGEYHMVKNKFLANSQQRISACQQPCWGVWKYILRVRPSSETTVPAIL